MSKTTQPFCITVKNDYAFKRVFGSEENKAVLQDFLECVLDIQAADIEGLELLDKELPKDALHNKTAVLDVKLSLKDGSLIDIEIQNCWTQDFPQRTLYYWSRLYIERFKAGESYTNLKRCITINIVAERFRLNEAVHSTYQLLETKTHSLLSDTLAIHFLDLTKARNAAESGDSGKLIRWLRFIDTENEEERTMLAKTSDPMRKAHETVEAIARTPHERRLYEARMKQKSDIASLVNDGIQRGLAQGLERGIRQKALETAHNLRAMGLSNTDIQKATGLSVDEIEQLSGCD